MDGQQPGLETQEVPPPTCHFVRSESLGQILALGVRGNLRAREGRITERQEGAGEVERGGCIRGRALYVAHPLPERAALPPGQPEDGGEATDVTGAQVAAGPRSARPIRSRDEGPGGQGICRSCSPGGGEQGRWPGLVPASPPGR